ncbi:cytochrome c biogenesis heme-transporting ATPase CcmA [Aliikangiella sp. IMCC44653]
MLVEDARYNPENRFEVTDLTVVRGDYRIFEPVSFKLSAGEALQISGANGAGKTTLIRALCGLTRSAEGMRLWNGKNIFASKSEYKQALLYIGHSLGLKPKLTVMQNLEFFQSLRFPLNTAQIDEALQRFDIAELADEAVSYLSAGQKRRVALARIMTEPTPLWILDEPLVALDTRGQAWMLQRCNQHLAHGGMLIVTSHQAVTGIQGLKELNLL